VSSSKNRVGVEERASADVGTALLHADDEGEVSLVSSDSADNLDSVLGDGHSHGDCGHRKGSKRLEVHLDESLGRESERRRC
jgi:hypothetical protein